jgi:hypothetical protein
MARRFRNFAKPKPPLPTMAEREVLVFQKLREHGGWVTGKEAASWFPDWSWQVGYRTMQKLVAGGSVEKRPTDQSYGPFGHPIPEYRAVHYKYKYRWDDGVLRDFPPSGTDAVVEIVNMCHVCGAPMRESGATWLCVAEDCVGARTPRSC